MAVVIDDEFYNARLVGNPARAKRLIFMFRLMFIFYVLSMFTTMYMITILHDSPALIYSDRRILVLEAATGFINIPLSIVTILFFIQWFHACYKTVLKLNSSSSPAAGWAVGGWFIPLANLVFPYVIMKKILSLNLQFLVRKPAGNKTAGLVLAWWLLYVAGTYCSLAVEVWKLFKRTPNAYLVSLKADFISLFLLIISIYFVLRIIYIVSRMESLVAEKINMADHIEV